MKRLLLSLSFIICHLSFSFAQKSAYQMAGPYVVVARDGQYRNTKAGSERDMWQAWQRARQGDDATALTIINAYAQTLQRFDGHDAPLCTIQAYWLLRAMTLMKWKIENGKWKMDSLSVQPNVQSSIFNLQSWATMVRRAILPVIDKFEADSPYANGNWGHIVNRCRMAAAIFMDDEALYQHAVDIYLHANDNGSLPNYIGDTGQCQETGRDQGHAQLGLGAMCEICEMAWSHGDDLWGALDNRLMKGMEYSARYNLGYDVPFERWTDCTGLYNDWTEPGEMGRGNIRCIYDLPYQHYVGRKGLKMPYTKKLLALQAKAEQRGELKRNPEADQFKVAGVKEGVKLHCIYTYPAPAGAPLKHDYDVYIQPRGQKEWTKIDTYAAKVHNGEISYAFFDFTGDVFVRVITKNKKFSSARIRPDYRGTIANVQNDSTVQFMLFQPENVSVEFSLNPDLSPKEEGSGYSLSDNLLLFTSKPPVTKEEAQRQAKEEGRKFIYFPPGYYTQADIDSITNQAPLPSGGTRRGLLPSGGTGGWVFYLAGGSYFTGTFAIDNAENVSILGRGVARPERGYEGCHVYRSKNVLVDGLIVNTCPIGESDGVTLHDVRSISHPQWGDGLNVFGGSSNILFDRVFCRNSDDCTTVYATRKDFKGSVRNVRMTNSTLWADVAHPIFIGLHGRSTSGRSQGENPVVGDSIVNLKYDNIDIICQCEPQVDYQGCLAINCGDGNYVKDVTFDNIRIELPEQVTRQASIVQVKVGWNQKYCTAAGAGIENVLFRNIRYYGEQPNLSIITGYDAQHKVKNVTFEGLKINGRAIYDDMPGKPGWYATSDMVPMFVGSHVEGLRFAK